MQLRQLVAPILADQIKQGADKRNIVVREQPAGRLKPQQTQQTQHRQRPQRVVPDTRPLTAQVKFDFGRRGEKLGKSCVGRAHHAPDQPENHQPNDEQAQAAVPVHEIAADLGADEGCRDAERQQPVKQTGRHVPKANTLAGHKFGNTFWRCGLTRLA